MRHRVRIRGLALYLCSGNWQCQYIKLIGLVSVCCTLCSRKDAINLREATALCLSSSPPSPLPICLMLAHKQTGADPGPWERRSMKVKYRRKRSIRKYTLSTIYHGWRGERIEIWMFAQSKYYIYNSNMLFSSECRMRAALFGFLWSYKCKFQFRKSRNKHVESDLLFREKQ